MLNVFTFQHDIEVLFKCESMVNQCSLCASSISLPANKYLYVFCTWLSLVFGALHPTLASSEFLLVVADGAPSSVARFLMA